MSKLLRKFAWWLLTKTFRDAPYIKSYSGQVKGVNYTLLRMDDYLES